MRTVSNPTALATLERGVIGMGNIPNRIAQSAAESSALDGDALAILQPLQRRQRGEPRPGERTDLSVTTDRSKAEKASP
jgi:hypothetical protein